MVDSNDIICIAQSLIKLQDGSWEKVGQKSVPDNNVPSKNAPRFYATSGKNNLILSSKPKSPKNRASPELISKIENFNNYPHILNQCDMVIKL